MEELAKFFADFEFEVPDLKILSQKQADKMEREFNSLVIGKTVKEFGSGVTRDCFVNVPQ
jgi:hypothetical protein